MIDVDVQLSRMAPKCATCKKKLSDDTNMRYLATDAARGRIGNAEPYVPSPRGECAKIFGFFVCENGVFLVRFGIILCN